MNKKIDDFEKILAPLKDIQFLLHQIVSQMRKLNRDGKIEDYTFMFLHNDIDLIFKNTYKINNLKK